MIEVNLHPQGAKRRRKKGRAAAIKLPAVFKGGTEGRDPWIIAAAVVPVVVVVFVGLLFFMQRGSLRDLEADLEDARADSTRLTDLRLLSDSLQRRNAENQERIALVRDLDENRFVWPHILDEIGRSLPDFTWLTEIQAAAPFPDLAVRVEGLAANPLAITEFVRRLERSPYFSDVQILGSQQQRVEDVEAQGFSLNLTYGAPPDSVVRRIPIVVGGS